MPTEEIKILNCHQELKSIKLPSAIYVDFQTILEKTNTCEKTLKYPILQILINIELAIFLTFTNHKSKCRQSFYHTADYMVKFCEIMENVSYKIISI